MIGAKITAASFLLLLPCGQQLSHGLALVSRPDPVVSHSRQTFMLTMVIMVNREASKRLFLEDRENGSVQVQGLLWLTLACKCHSKLAVSLWLSQCHWDTSSHHP